MLARSTTAAGSLRAAQRLLPTSHRLAVSRPSTVRAMAAQQNDVKLDKTTPDSVWKQILGAEEYHVLREAGTERAGSGKYNKTYDEGTYVCGGCGTPLYKSEAKFNSGCGWPAFYEEIKGSLEHKVDNSFGMRRVEIVCAKCGGHQGHVFENEGFPTPTNVRLCVNSASVKFVPKQE